MKITPAHENAKHADADWKDQLRSQYKGIFDSWSDEFFEEFKGFAQGIIDSYTTTPSASEAANFADTPVRAVKGWLSLLAEAGATWSQSENQYPLAVLKLIQCLRGVVLHSPNSPDTFMGCRKMTPSSTFSEEDVAVWHADGLRNIAAYPSSVVTNKDQLLTRDLPEILSTGFPMEASASDPGLITQGPIQMQSLCPHHLLPVIYEAYVSYLPDHGGTVLGLSKLARLAVLLARRPVLQEQLTNDIADVLHYSGVSSSPLPQIDSQGSAVQLIGKHTCMSCRGVKSNALTLTTSLRGAYARNGDVKEEFYNSIESISRSTLLK